ncbi:MAG: hypothetical protein IJ863_05210 [Spirochaetales bacterium]|nr:hypothetical protein [Spirochaetales bacterium]
MKKVIAILAIMVVLVGAVFAAAGDRETHTIKLKTKVAGDDPIFALNALYVDANSANITTATNSEDKAFENGSQFTGAKEIQVADLSKSDVAVTFYAKLVNQAKSTDTFTITFVPGPFNVKKLDASNNRIDAKIYATNNAETSAIGAAATGYTLGNLNIAAGEQISYTNTITFTGAQVATSDNVLATYSVTYAKDEQIAQNTADEAFYYADCVMTVTMN